jgi:outer membrane cobalamin receptor
VYVRAAGYEGFRQPSLNELYRPTPGGDSFVDANPALEPERLSGAELGIGGVEGRLTWNITGFWNRLSGAISNVTLGIGPGLFPDVGFLPAGDLYVQRENVGYNNGVGGEGEAQLRVDDGLTLRAAFNVTDARVNGGQNLPALTGKRPAQAPAISVSGGVILFPFPELAIEADAVYVSKRFANDRNTIMLGAGAVFNATITWHFRTGAGIYIAATNIGNTRLALLEGGDHIPVYSQPFAIRAGLLLNLTP